MLVRVIFLLLIWPQIVFASHCEEQAIYCTAPAETRKVEGRDVHRECWQYKYKLNCNRSSKNDCGKILVHDCSFVEEECLSRAKEGDLEFCSNFKRHYACEKKVEYEEEKVELLKNGQQPDAKDLMCSVMCLDGECRAIRKAKDTEDKDLANAVAMLNALKEAKKGLNHNALINIFKGDTKSCDKKIAGYSNCCQMSSGWGKILGASCGPAASDLAKKRREKKCVEVGSYCSTKVPLLGCVIRRTTFCCYDSVIAKLLNQEAKKQLGKNNGSVENPSCGGLSLEDIQKVDFSKTDFSEFYQEVIVPNIKIPDVKMAHDNTIQSAEQIKRNTENKGFKDGAQ